MSNTRLKTIGVVLVNWNTSSLTRDCVCSLLKGTRRPDVILVIDNGSSPEDAAKLASLQGVELRLLDSNRGFAAANNLGFSDLLTRGVDYVWILNNDTVVAEDCLEKLIMALDRQPDVGAVTGLIYFADPPDCIWFAGGYFHRWTLTAHHRGAFEVDRGQYRKAEDIAFISGCCILARANTLYSLGGFHPSFFSYWEDTEWSLRARAKKVRLHYEPKAILWHKVSSSLKRNTQSGFFEKLFFRNWIYTLRLHARLWKWPMALAAVLRCALKSACQAWRRRDRAAVAAIWSGVRAGFADPLPPAPRLIEDRTR